jgi:hypothetical protein
MGALQQMAQIAASLERYQDSGKAILFQILKQPAGTIAISLLLP